MYVLSNSVVLFYTTLSLYHGKEVLFFSRHRSRRPHPPHRITVILVYHPFLQGVKRADTSWSLEGPGHVVPILEFSYSGITHLNVSFFSSGKSSLFLARDSEMEWPLVFRLPKPRIDTAGQSTVKLKLGRHLSC